MSIFNRKFTSRECLRSLELGDLAYMASLDTTTIIQETYRIAATVELKRRTEDLCKSGQTVSAEERKSLAGGHIWMSVLAGTVYERLSVLKIAGLPASSGRPRMSWTRSGATRHPENRPDYPSAPYPAATSPT